MLTRGATLVSVLILQQYLESQPHFRTLMKRWAFPYFSRTLHTMFSFSAEACRFLVLLLHSTPFFLSLFLRGPIHTGIWHGLNLVNSVGSVASAWRTEMNVTGAFFPITSEFNWMLTIQLHNGPADLYFQLHFKKGWHSSPH